MSNLVTSSIISPTGEVVGNLTVDIVPYNDEDMEFEDVPENSDDLIGEQLKYRIFIKEASGLPDNFCRDCYVEYKPFLDDKEEVVRTKIVI